MPIATVNPATGETLRTFAAHTAQEVEEKLERAVRAFREGRRTPYAERAARLSRAAGLLDEKREELARLMTTEMGKPVQAARDEAAKCATACRYYAEHGELFLADEEVNLTPAAARGFVRYQPLGVILAVMPWNFPLWQVFRFAAPALMAGNVGLLKHASNVPQCALAIQSLLAEAGFPDGVFQTLLVNVDQVANLIADERVAAATLTGSESAGRSVAAACGQHIKKTVLELGGSDPFVVMPSADLNKALDAAVKARTINNGQSCIAAKRFVVHRDVYDEFERGFTERMSRLVVGDPMDSATQIGPLATAGILRDLDEQVKKSVSAGARLLLGGAQLERPGNYYPPTVLTDIPIAAPAYREELFGPVASLFRVADAGDAIRVANDSSFGLASSVWTNDEDERRRFADEIEAGSVFVNAIAASDARLPFGGVKLSGYGRELGVFGIREFVNVKTIWVAGAGGQGESGDTE